MFVIFYELTILYVYNIYIYIIGYYILNDQNYRVKSFTYNFINLFNIIFHTEFSVSIIIWYLNYPSSLFLSVIYDIFISYIYNNFNTNTCIQIFRNA